jgi:preprotein translocase subunit SecA
MVDALSMGQPEPSADPTAPPPAPVAIPLDPLRLRSAVYRQYGAYLDCNGVLEDRTGTLDRLAREVGSSMIQQRERLLDLSEEMIQVLMAEFCPESEHAEDWDLAALSTAVKERFGFEPSFDDKLVDREAVAEALWSQLEKIIEARESEFSLPVLLYFSRYFYLEEIDQRWIDHLKAMEALREGIGLRGYAQKDPKQEYKKEGFVIFGEMMGIIGRNVCEKLYHMQLRRESEEPAAAPALPAAQPKKARRMIESGGGVAPQVASGNGAPAQPEGKPVRRNEPKVGRNDPCPCGSGKKYKKCHGAVVSA